MSAKAIREASGKHLLNKFLPAGAAVKSNVAVVTADTDWTSLAQDHPWLLSEVCYIRCIGEDREWLSPKIKS